MNSSQPYQQNGTYQQPPPNYYQQPVPVPQPPQKDVKFQIAAILIVIIVVLGILALAFIDLPSDGGNGLIDDEPDNETTDDVDENPPEAETPYCTVHAKELILTIDDFSSLGWSESTSQYINYTPEFDILTGYHSTFTYFEMIGTYGAKQIMIDTKIWTFNSTENATAAYQLKKASVTYSSKSMDLGEESIGFIEYTQNVIYFRVANVLVRMESYAEYTNFDLDDLKGYGEIIEHRIDSNMS